MSQEYIEVTEKTLDDAITSACQKLSVTSDKLDYVVISEGSSGFLGFNAKPAIIKARVKEAREAAENVLQEVLRRAEDAVQKKEERKPEKKEPAAPVKEAEKAEEKKTEERSVLSGKNISGKEKNHTEGKQERRSSRRHAEKPLTPEEITEVKERASAFLRQVFGAMNMEVAVRLEYDEENNILVTSFEGEEMGVLIGKRGQTLDSLQYLVSLVVNKGLDSYIHVKADTENYRERRKKTLENLAKNIAMKVKRTKHSVTLEPMNPYERRIIHSVLQGDRYVTTYSEGEEPYRKVVVALKK